MSIEVMVFAEIQPWQALSTMATAKARCPASAEGHHFTKFYKRTFTPLSARARATSAAAPPF